MIFNQRTIVRFALVSAVIGVVGLVLLPFLSAWFVDDGIVVDDAQMAETKSRLEEVQVVLDSSPSYEGTKAVQAAGQSPCYEDPSGDYLAQPSAYREWSLTRVSESELSRLAELLADDLADRGWKVIRAPDSKAEWRLVFDSGSGWTATGSILPTYSDELWSVFQRGEPAPVTEDAVHVWLEIRGATPCHLSIWRYSPL